MVTPARVNAPAVPSAHKPIDPTAEQLAEARAWLKDCEWVETADDPDFTDCVADPMIVRAIERHYQGGWPQFLRDGLTATEHPELTLYLIRCTPVDDNRADIDPVSLGLSDDPTLRGPDEEDGVLILGRDEAERVRNELGCRPDVLEVSCAPLGWGTGAEHRALFATNGFGLHAPLAAIATQWSVDFDPDNFDVIALLDHLRGLQRVPS